MIFTSVARSQELNGALSESYTGRGPSSNYITCSEGSTFGKGLDQSWNREYEIVCGSILALLPINEGLYAEFLGEILGWHSDWALCFISIG